MKPIIARLAEVREADTLLEWMHNTPNNLFDPQILSYPTLTTLAAGKESYTIAYLPAQTVLMLESLAVSKAADPLEKVRAFETLVKAFCVLASTKGIREVYFLCADESVIRYAEMQGFSPVQAKLLRLKLPYASNNGTHSSD